MGTSPLKDMERPAVIAFCAHNDDHVIGAGGTLAQYAREGTDVIIVIFSYGELTHPWLQRKVAIKMRVDESRRADKILGANRVYYFGLTEGNFLEEIKAKKIAQRIKRIISIVRPQKIFTHSPDDPHPDHRAVYSTITTVMDESRYQCDVYSFDIWNPFNIRAGDKPKLVVDVTKTFRIKTRAFRLHKSQWLARATMVPAIYVRALWNGLENGVRYAEVFVKLR
jgi:LmbE family N-acetylglucosaminyl deacetylase